MGVLGATGYTGRELVRLLAGHPRVQIAFATSENSSRLRVPGADVELTTYEEAVSIAADLVFCCLPHGDAGAATLRFTSLGARVVDLSADHRPPAGTGAYGLPELYREGVREAVLVANPGCYPSGLLLGLVPLLREELVASAPVVVDAASGVTGAGRTPKRELLFAEIAEDYRAYAPGNEHRHLPEMRWAIAEAGGGISLAFTPHLLPVRRGILETVYVPLRTGTAADVLAVWSAAYSHEPFIEIFRDRPPALSDAVGRNVVCLFARDLKAVEPPMVQLVIALDNLLKGASGQALQNANLMLGYDERLGLPR